MGYVPQGVSVDSSLTGYENLLIFAKLYDIPRRKQEKRIREALEFMNLSADGDRLVGEYSGGMIRRLEIAQSTLHRPKLLFLDEPTVGLDPIARDAVWKHLVDLQTNYGTTLFFTTHYMEEVESYCDRVAIMRLGKVAAIGTCKELEASLGNGSHTLNEVFVHYAGNAIYPTSIMPNWLQAISHLNPLTYVVDALRTCMLFGSTSSFGLPLDYAIILITTIILVFLGSQLYPRLAT
ncbi:ATP-binding cassette domain-containing protein [Pseudanabaena sp. UWO310]|uniref:ATP-binding cassette domain-containing protein n=1 Tax=Pseudanabaena sp. UWO310 TaxID=2480795 RepID=UPI0021DF6710|nr:ATP-binding cassette domain-containing protein [Pseudanabaena sp. UWO310]